MCRNYLSQPKKKRRWSKTYAFEVSEREGGPGSPGPWMAGG